jgi:hypothetical protein
MELALALTAVGKGVALFALTGLAAPLIGLALRHFVGSGWDSIGSGPFSIVHESSRRRGGGRGPAVDPAIQAAEVRQMLEAKAARQERRGEDPLDVESEAERLLAENESAAERRLDIDAELRAEVRQLVMARNERRMRAGQTPLDVEAEIERQLNDFVGSS